VTFIHNVKAVYKWVVLATQIPSRYVLVGNKIHVLYPDVERYGRVVEIGFLKFYLGKYSSKILVIDLPNFVLNGGPSAISKMVRVNIQELYNELQDTRACVAYNFEFVYKTLSPKIIKDLLGETCNTGEKSLDQL
jgi:hypothetical protein